MAEEFKTKLADAGVTKLVFIRHASAAPPGGKAKGEYNQIHDWQRDDQMRPLTDKGKQQAKAARVWYTKHVGNKSNKVLVTSGARRASETLQILTEEQAKGGGIFASILGCSSPDAVATQATMDLVGSLHPAGIAPKCEEMFDTLGYGPMTKFYEKDGGKQAFDDYAELVIKEMCGLIGKVGKNPGNTITSFGHAVFLNAVAMIVAEKVWDADSATVKALSELDLGESEGIILTKTASGMTMTHMKC